MIADSADSRAALLRALSWLLDAGADSAVLEQPEPLFDAAARRAPPGPPPGPPPRPSEGGPEERRPSPLADVPTRRDPVTQEASPALWRPDADGPPLSSDAAARDARRLAEAAGDLAALHRAIEAFEGCALKQTATRTVIFRGNPGAEIMLIGEAPGRDEDLQGQPFVGAAGRLLDQMLLAAGFDPSALYITNVLFWRPPGNRTPESREIAACLPFVERSIALLRPRLLMLIGNVSAKALLGETRGITRLRGQWFAYRQAGMAAPLPALATLHPAYLLRQPAQKRLAWQDLLKFKQAAEGRINPLSG